MRMPNVLNVLIDRVKNVRYEVIAYRALKAHELRTAVRVFLSGVKRKPRINSVVRITTIIGARD